MSIMNVSDYTIKPLIILGWVHPETDSKTVVRRAKSKKIDVLAPLRKWINNINVKTPKMAHRICQLIPAQCPFARTIKLFGRTILTIPPLCKINPVYEELMMLRFTALSYLAEECGEDISAYC
ncbi:MAG: hypothetical protein N5P05_003660 [Chroococcopsis gigantea SAG 12.99]|nr:hypothetical protein [Chroococcopsis gigantea SAG 12.99]